MNANHKEPRLQENMITIEDVARRLNLTERSIRTLIANNEIPYRKLGSGKKPPVRFYPSEVEAWIDKRGVKVVLRGE